MNFLCQDLSNIYTSTHLHTLTFIPYIYSQVCTPTIALVIRWSREIRVSQKIIFYFDIHQKCILNRTHFYVINLFPVMYTYDSYCSPAKSKNKGLSKVNFLCSDLSIICTFTHLHTLTFIGHLYSQVCTSMIALVLLRSQETRVSRK